MGLGGFSITGTACPLLSRGKRCQHCWQFWARSCGLAIIMVFRAWGGGREGHLGHEDEGLGQAGPSTGSGKEAVSAGIEARTTDSQERILEVM